MFHTWKIIRMSTYIWLNFLMIIVFKAIKEMILSYKFMVGDDDVLFVMIIFEGKLLRLELVQLIIENITLNKEKFRKIKVLIKIILAICRNSWNLNLVILFY